MLINCVAYQQGRKLADIQPHEIPRHLAMSVIAAIDAYLFHRFGKAKWL